MYCQYCGASIVGGVKYCPVCGTRQEPAAASALAQNRCPFCGELLEADAAFCEYCGKAVSGQQPPAANAPHKPDVMTPPPIPEDLPAPVDEPRRTAEPSAKKTNALPIVIAVILGVALLAFGIIQYGGSILALIRPEEPMPPDFEMDPPTVLTPEPEATAIPEATPEPIKESTPAPEITPEPIPEAPPEPAVRYDPAEYETTDDPTAADFQWATYDILYGTLPDGIDRLMDFEEVRGGWKLYIVDDPYGEYGSEMEYLGRAAIGSDDNGSEFVIHWSYVYNGALDEVYEADDPDSFYYGAWDNGVLDALGVGSVTITDFWYANDHEYAVGRMTWPDGIPSVMFLVRP